VQYKEENLKDCCSWNELKQEDRLKTKESCLNLAMVSAILHPTYTRRLQAMLSYMFLSTGRRVASIELTSKGHTANRVGDVRRHLNQVWYTNGQTLFSTLPVTEFQGYPKTSSLEYTVLIPKSPSPNQDTVRTPELLAQDNAWC
jgi:hypothetical protein